ncbi:E3 ubiquitin-protein ligase DTX3L-like [Aplochiton taeniatus]
MDLKDTLISDGLTLDLSHWMLMKAVFDGKITSIQKKFGVEFTENTAHGKVTVKAQPTSAVPALSLESHALRALVLLYQRVATSVLSCTLKDPNQAREVGSKLEELRPQHPFVGNGQDDGLWKLIGLPEHLGPAVWDLEKILGGPVFKEDEKQRIGYKSRPWGAVGGAKAEGTDEKDENCPICMDTFTDKEKLKCGHEFCSGCLKKSVASQLGATCPVCKAVFGKVEGNQPEGTIGNCDCGRHGIFFNADIVDLVLGDFCFQAKHPSPGKHYQATSRTAYLPDNTEGNEVLTLLKRAFDQKLIFTVGTSRTNGIDNCVTWNDIHHKTSLNGGILSYGYPDPEYLKRVKEELKAKGIE